MGLKEFPTGWMNPTDKKFIRWVHPSGGDPKTFRIFSEFGRISKFNR
jgi:hypothetical protein